ncbi:MAG: DUF2975 domain-containing protein [Gemmatimonadales bacterium]
MPRSQPDTLALSAKVLRILIRLNLLAGGLILALLVATLVAEGPVMAALGAGTKAENGRLFIGMRVVAVLGLLAVPVVHRILIWITAVVSTVQEGDPFVAVNAGRLTSVAWAALLLELLHTAVGIVAAVASTATTPFDIGWRFSPTRWLTVLLLFVLARVFEQGTRMRDDLAGTV